MCSMIPEPELPLEYKDDVIKWGVLLCFVWGVIGFCCGRYRGLSAGLS